MESVLLYECEAWTVTPKLSKDLDGCYTRLLRIVFNVNWKQRITNKELYGSLPKVSEKIRDRRLRFAGHCCRSKEEPTSRLLLWRPKHGKRKADRPTITYTDVLQQDTGLETPDMRTAMLDRSVWRAITVLAQVSRLKQADRQASFTPKILHISRYVWYYIKDNFLLFLITKDWNLHDTK